MIQIIEQQVCKTQRNNLDVADVTLFSKKNFLS